MVDVWWLCVAVCGCEWLCVVAVRWWCVDVCG
jgi:hypothetical protein